MSRENAIEKIKEFERFGSRLGLERMSVLMERLGNPQKDLKYIHVAGTNGKGSVCRYLYEGLQGNGYKVGLFTSPFLQVFNERIEFDHQLISDEDLERCTGLVLEQVEEMMAKGLDSPTEFEVITAVAFVYFHLKKADFVILEVGLGGRGDSTNVIEKPLASVITSISYDHMDRLGNTLAEIASEKAGIIKEGVPVIMNVDRREAAKVLAKEAYEKNCVLHDVSKIKYAITEKSIEGYSLDTNIYGTDYAEVQISMAGKHQMQNVLTALVTLELLRKDSIIKVERSRLYAGLKKARQMGRFEVMKENPYVIIDGAHNEDGAAALKKTAEELLPDQKILFVTGMLGDKDTEKILDHFCQIADDFVVTEPDNSRKYPAVQLAEDLEKRGKHCVVLADSAEACRYALAHRENYGAVIFAGSLYLIGEIRGLLKDKL
ncbi:bifunctional folylpolyglutamate synthase/dihydrofolate synthase [Aminipila butyrica]|uniref:tetrahydrofolate synthase n=1 Tax=Aminipila butyrica TaxID=433296 RepID=A0A858BW07_9FIRM|nr:folylpolyglutamate synthase/dihydrofolate synthase family protein [Aminipila butyrica]QIB68914.1 bifunctional folylpolyglutamate synthase/dihydrofolate synthase [Aminipila butyrica]